MLFRNGPDGGMIIPPVQIEAVNPGLDATNRIRIEASGEVLTITVNDEALPPLQFPDGIIFDGMAGVILQGADADGVRARFDNFRLEELEWRWPQVAAPTPPQPARTLAPAATRRAGRATW
jgi:hypothetical protein